MNDGPRYLHSWVTVFLQVLNAAFPPRHNTTAIRDNEKQMLFCQGRLQLPLQSPNMFTKEQEAEQRIRVEKRDWTERRAERDNLRGTSAVWKGVISSFVPAAVTWCAPRSAPRLAAALLLFSLMQRSFCTQRKGTWENFKDWGTRHQSLARSNSGIIPSQNVGLFAPPFFFFFVGRNFVFLPPLPLLREGGLLMCVLLNISKRFHPQQNKQTKRKKKIKWCLRSFMPSLIRELRLKGAALCRRSF